MGIPGHLTCLLRILCAGQEATVRTRRGTADWFQIGKGIHLGSILSACLFYLYAEYIIWNAGLDETQAGIKNPGRNINKLKYTDGTTIMSDGEEELRASWWKWKWRVKKLDKTQHSENYDHGIRSHHFMSNRWGHNGNNERLYFLLFQNHCRWWLQPWN